jgi:hypothetical protein
VDHDQGHSQPLGQRSILGVQMGEAIGERHTRTVLVGARPRAEVGRWKLNGYGVWPQCE